MINPDEPVLGDDVPKWVKGTEGSESLRGRIQQLVTEESYGVLCTQNEGQPYGSMIAFAFADDLSSAVFATSRFTRKYELLTACKRVAIVVNNREKFPNDLNKIEAITVTGHTEELRGDASDSWLIDLLIKKHPHLQSFIVSPSTVVFRVRVVRFFHVHRFQEVREWVPALSEE